MDTKLGCLLPSSCGTGTKSWAGENPFVHAGLHATSSSSFLRCGRPMTESVVEACATQALPDSSPTYPPVVSFHDGWSTPQVALVVVLAAVVLIVLCKLIFVQRALQRAELALAEMRDTSRTRDAATQFPSESDAEELALAALHDVLRDSGDDAAKLFSDDELTRHLCAVNLDVQAAHGRVVATAHW